MFLSGDGALLTNESLSTESHGYINRIFAFDATFDEFEQAPNSNLKWTRIALNWQSVGCGEGSCAPTCGDGILSGPEACDDGNQQPGDGCDEACNLEDGFLCSNTGACRAICGDGQKTDHEGCDDNGNLVDGDGCSFKCNLEPGYLCDEQRPQDCERLPECEQTQSTPCFDSRVGRCEPSELCLPVFAGHTRVIEAPSCDENGCADVVCAAHTAGATRSCGTNVGNVLRGFKSVTVAVGVRVPVSVHKIQSCAMHSMTIATDT